MADWMLRVRGVMVRFNPPTPDGGPFDRRNPWPIDYAASCVLEHDETLPPGEVFVEPLNTEEMED
jgi:hypothetical protein